jgi:hypothetical protein
MDFSQKFLSHATLKVISDLKKQFVEEVITDEEHRRC